MTETNKQQPTSGSAPTPSHGQIRTSTVSHPTITYPAYPPRTLVRPHVPTTTPAEAVGTLPNVVIIGAMKCGTTSLHEYLGYHPEVTMSRRKETNFFVQQQNWTKGLSWYRENFVGAGEVVGETSPNYTRYPVFPGVPERMHQLLPGARLLYCVRDPIKRMVSHYVHSYSLGRENRPFEEAMRAEGDNPYLLCSLYYYQLEQYLRFYDPAQIKVVALEDMKDDPLPTLESVFAFLGVDPSYEDSRFTSASATMPPAAKRRRSPVKNWMVRNKLRGVYWIERNTPWLFGPPINQPYISRDLRDELGERLKDDVAALRALTGLELGSWKI